MTLEHEALTGRIIGAAIQVHRALGPGYLESVYEEAMATELEASAMPFQRQRRVPIIYRNVEVGLHRLDLFVADRSSSNSRLSRRWRTCTSPWSGRTCEQ